ncbi:hypothetical protein B0H19DRAFT_942653 [Mycena capillaripes]|nr:hypothetical protein B0H19DRAFT_942653 [Mycena capillaripes]
MSASIPTLIPGEAQTQIIFLLGPWIIGCCFDLVLQGVLFSQFANYFTWYRDDKGALKAAVAGLCLLTSLKSVQAFVIIWNHSIVHFDDFQGVMMELAAWWEAGNHLMVAVIGLYVQAYFLFRLHVFSRSSYVVAPLGVIFLFAFLAMVIATYYITQHDVVKIASWFTAHFSAVFAGDIILSCTIAFFLIKTRRHALPETAGIIDTLIRLTFQTAAPATLCAMLNLIFASAFVGDKALFSIVFNMPLPKLYAASMMYTLNARHQIRTTHKLVRFPCLHICLVLRSNGVEQGVELSAIQVFSKTQTEQHVDVRRAGLVPRPRCKLM